MAAERRRRFFAGCSGTVRQTSGGRQRENNHELLRYVCPKQTDLRGLGLTSQDKLNLVLSHVNSQKTEKLEGKSPLTFTAFLSEELFQKLNAFGINLIRDDEVVLTPELLKDQK